VQPGEHLERGVTPGAEQLSDLGVQAQRAPDEAGFGIASEIGAATHFLQGPVRALQSGGGASAAEGGLGRDLGGAAPHHPVPIEAVNGAAGLGDSLGDAGELAQGRQRIRGTVRC
jgi:hypothetical protein